MKKRSAAAALVASGIGMICLILDSRNASQWTFDAIELCIRTVIPSLFPMFVLSALAVGILSGSQNPILRLVEKVLGLPSGGGSIFLLGAVGGFPVGAQCIAQSVESGHISRENGQRMLGYCNNCSPAFLFGLLGRVFPGTEAPLLIFCIQLEAAMLTALLWPVSEAASGEQASANISLPAAVSRAVRSMVSVCAWVILAGVVCGFLNRWLFPLLPSSVPELITGLLEITGGVLGLRAVESEGMRLVLCAVFVCFGGVSVLFQIQSIASGQALSIHPCICQKLTQAIIGGILAAGVTGLGPAILAIPTLILPLWKKAVEIPGKPLYNSFHKGGI